MRLDLFLKQSGLIKRRPIAKALCDAGRVGRNGAVAKASDEVRMGDTLEITHGPKTTTVEVLLVPVGSVGRAQREELFRIVSEG